MGDRVDAVEMGLLQLKRQQCTALLMRGRFARVECQFDDGSGVDA